MPFVIPSTPQSPPSSPSLFSVNSYNFENNEHYYSYLNHPGRLIIAVNGTDSLKFGVDVFNETVKIQFNSHLIEIPLALWKTFEEGRATAFQTENVSLLDTCQNLEHHAREEFYLRSEFALHPINNVFGGPLYHYAEEGRDWTSETIPDGSVHNPFIVEDDDDQMSSTTTWDEIQPLDDITFTQRYNPLPNICEDIEDVIGLPRAREEVDTDWPWLMDVDADQENILPNQETQPLESLANNAGQVPWDIMKLFY